VYFLATKFSKPPHTSRMGRFCLGTSLKKWDVFSFLRDLFGTNPQKWSKGPGSFLFEIYSTPPEWRV